MFEQSRKVEVKKIKHQLIILFYDSHKKVFICLNYPKIMCTTGEIIFIGKGPPKNSNCL